MTKTGVDQALQTAYVTFRHRKRWLSAPDRIAILEKTAAIMRSRFDTLAIESAREYGSH